MAKLMRRVKSRAAAVAAGLTVASLLGSGPALAATQVNRVDYLGWKDCYELTNGIARIVVVPQIGGRIMEYSVNGHNIVWQNPELKGQVVDDPGGWPNYGGYKLWNAPQDRWGWPPDPALDGAPAVVKPIGTTGLKITGQLSPELGMRFVKEIYLASDSSRAVISQRLFSAAEQDQDWSVWDVTQVTTPGMAALPTNPASAFTTGLRAWDNYGKATMDKTVDVKDGIAVVTHGSGKDMKFGTDSPVGWAAYTSGALLYIKRFPNPVKGETYPDNGLNAEVYISGSMGYVEVEILGPMTFLEKARFTSFNEEWLLIELTEPIPTPDAFRKVLAGLQGELRGFSK